MRRIVQMTSLLLAGAVLAGCHTLNTLESQARVDPRTVAAYPRAGERLQSEDNCDARFRGDYYDVSINLDCFHFPNDSTLAYDRAALTLADRNRLASVLIKHSDDVCVKEMGDLSAREAISNTALGVATSALSGVSSIVSGERVKSWLAGGAGFTNATRDHINAEVFRNVLASALAKAIQSERDKQRKILLAEFRKTPASYSVDQMIMDVNRYHQACSFYNGLVLVVDAVNRASPSVANEYRDLSAAINDLEAQIEEYERKIERTRDPATKAALKKAMGELIDEHTKKFKERAALGGPAPAEEPPANGGNGNGS